MRTAQIASASIRATSTVGGAVSHGKHKMWGTLCKVFPFLCKSWEPLAQPHELGLFSTAIASAKWLWCKWA